MDRARSHGPGRLGLLIGFAGAVGSTRLFQHLLFGVSAFDPWSFAGAALMLLLVALAASYVPARRAPAWIRSSRCATDAAGEGG